MNNISNPNRYLNNIANHNPENKYRLSNHHIIMLIIIIIIIITLIIIIKHLILLMNCLLLLKKIKLIQYRLQKMMMMQIYKNVQKVVAEDSKKMSQINMSKCAKRYSNRKEKNSIRKHTDKHIKNKQNQKSKDKLKIK